MIVVVMHSKSQSRRLAAYSVMPANEASGIGGRSYGRIALHLLFSLAEEMCIFLYRIYIYF